MTLTITPTVDVLVPQPRIRLVVAGTTGSPNPVGLGSSVQVFRTDPDGQRRRVIVEYGAVLSAGSWVGFDYHCPFNASVSYTAVVDGKTADPATVSMSSAVSWLIHPNNPSLSVQVTAINEIGDRTKASTAVASYPFASKYPITLWEGTRHSATGSIVVRLSSRTELDATDQLLGSSGPILLNLAAADQGSGWWDENWAWVQPGDITYSNPAGSIYYPFRHLSFPYTVVDTPAGVEVPLWTVNDALAQYASVNAVLAAFETVADFATNTVTSSGGDTGLLAPGTPGDTSNQFDGGNF